MALWKNLLKTLERAYLNVSNVDPAPKTTGKRRLFDRRTSVDGIARRKRKAGADGRLYDFSFRHTDPRPCGKNTRCCRYRSVGRGGGGGGWLRVPPPPLRRIVLGPTSARGCVLVVSVRVGEGRAPGFITATRTRPDGHSAVRFPSRQTCLVIATAAAVHSLCSVCR